MLKTYLALLGAAQKAFKASKADSANPADPFMTLLGYFNSLRELGGARRLIEDEVGNRLNGYANRRRVGEAEGYHESFYRSVEATSVTPFSPRALDRGLAGTLVALASVVPARSRRYYNKKPCLFRCPSPPSRQTRSSPYLRPRHCGRSGNIAFCLTWPPRLGF
jgi:hypothetical protein